MNAITVCEKTQWLIQLWNTFAYFAEQQNLIFSDSGF